MATSMILEICILASGILGYGLIPLINKWIKADKAKDNSKGVARLEELKSIIEKAESDLNFYIDEKNNSTSEVAKAHYDSAISEKNVLIANTKREFNLELNKYKKNPMIYNKYKGEK